MRDRIVSILDERISRYRQGFGIVVGLATPDDTLVVAAGSRDPARQLPMDEDGLFAIGSVTKVFTTTLLATMVERGELELDQPVQSLLPGDITLPTRDGQPITLEHLATHSSGLPNLPDNMTPNDGLRPAVEYSVGEMHRFLSSCTLSDAFGRAARYSNLGIGLLGHALGLRAGADFGRVLHDRVLSVLGMDSTHLFAVPWHLQDRRVPDINPSADRSSAGRAARLRDVDRSIRAPETSSDSCRPTSVCSTHRWARP
ncbi:MAG: beta-lactamase family protein [Myxococcales bacterium]|nr:beta-lactamase family protein [Myxococcales bacterium]